MPLEESSDDDQYNDKAYGQPYMGGDSQNDYMAAYGDPESQGDYEYAYGDEGMYGDEPEPPAQDIYMAGYEVGSQPGANPYGDAGEVDDDPYAGINIDYSKIPKPGEKKKVETKKKPPAKKPQKGKASPTSNDQSASENNPSQDYEKSEESNKVSADEYKENTESEIDKARVEENSEKSNEDNSNVGGSGEKVMNFAELKKLHEESTELGGSKGKKDALALADDYKQSVDSELDSKPVEINPEVNLQAQNKPKNNDEEKQQDSYSYTFTNSQADEQSADKVSKTAKRLEDKAGSIASEKKDIKVQPQKTDSVTPTKANELKPESSVENYSYADDFEQSSIPASSRDNVQQITKDNVKSVRNEEKVDEKPDEESVHESEKSSKPQYWEDFKKSEEKIKTGEKEQVTVVQNLDKTKSPNTDEKPIVQNILDILTKKLNTDEANKASMLNNLPQVTPQIVEYKKIRVDDKEIQTEMGGVQFADKTTRELQLEATVLEEKKKSRNLQIQIEEKDGVISRLQENLKKIELDCVSAQKNAANSAETVKRLMNENKDAMHQANLIKIEKEDLTRTNEDLKQKIENLEKDKVSIKTECDKKVKLAEERAEQKTAKFESRAVDELKHNFELEKAIFQKQMQDKEEELFYYKEKCSKYEAENTSLRLTNKVQIDAENKIRELQQENYVLQVKLGNIEKKDSLQEKDEKPSDAKLRHELEVQETLIKGYQKENENMTEEIRQLKLKLKEMETLMYKENVRMRDEQSKIVKNQEKVMVVDNNGDVAVDIWNKLGKSNVMSVAELKTLKLQMDMLQLDKKRLEEQIKRDAQHSQGEIGLLLKQKEELENRIGLKYENLEAEKQGKIKLQTELEEERKKRKEETEELRGRLKWLAENQEIVEKNAEIIKEKDDEIDRLKSKLKEISDNKSLKKSVRFADDEMKKVESSTTFTNLGEAKLKKQITDLTKKLKDTETNYETKLRSLQQQYEKVKNKFDGPKNSGLLEDRIKALEQEKEEIKSYYINKLRNAEKPSNTMPEKENLTNSFKNIINIPELSFVTKLLMDLQRLRNALKIKKQEDCDKIMEDITQVLSEVPEAQKEMVASIIDKIMNLGSNVTPNIKEATECEKTIAELETKLYSEMEKLQPKPAEPVISEKTNKEISKPRNEILVEKLIEEQEILNYENEICCSECMNLQKLFTNATVEFIQNKFDKEKLGKISPADFIEFIKNMQENDPILSQYLLTNKFSDNDGQIDYIITLDNLKTKSLDFWKQFFTTSYKPPQSLPLQIMPFLQALIAEKLKEFFNTNPIDTTLKNLQDSPVLSFTKLDLAKFFTDLGLKFNNEDLAVIFHLLSNSRGNIPKTTLAGFLVNPYNISKSNNTLIKEAWAEPENEPPNFSNESTPKQIKMQEFSKTAKIEEKWESKARNLYSKLKEMKDLLEKSESQKKDLEYKIQTICKDPKQKQILELQRKIESLETIVKERDSYIRKTMGGTGELQMTIMKRNSELEKAELLQVIANKNKEIFMFKSELDAVLASMEKLRKKKSHT